MFTSSMKRRTRVFYVVVVCALAAKICTVLLSKAIAFFFVAISYLVLCWCFKAILWELNVLVRIQFLFTFIRAG